MYQISYRLIGTVLFLAVGMLKVAHQVQVRNFQNHCLFHSGEQKCLEQTKRRGRRLSIGLTHFTKRHLRGSAVLSCSTSSLHI